MTHTHTQTYNTSAETGPYTPIQLGFQFSRVHFHSLTPILYAYQIIGHYFNWNFQRNGATNGRESKKSNRKKMKKKDNLYLLHIVSPPFLPKLFPKATCCFRYFHAITYLLLLLRPRSRSKRTRKMIMLMIGKEKKLCVVTTIIFAQFLCSIHSVTVSPAVIVVAIR